MTASQICCNHDCRQGRDCPLRAGMATTRQLLEDLLHPEELGHAVTPEVRARARTCLDMLPVEPHLTAKA